MLAPAELVRDFVNTYDVENDDDELASPAELVVWLRERDLIGPVTGATDDDLAPRVGLREGLRGALPQPTMPERGSGAAVARRPYCRSCRCGSPGARRARSRPSRGVTRGPGQDRGGRDGDPRRRDVAAAEGLRGGHVPVGVHRLLEEPFTLVVFDEGLR